MVESPGKISLWGIEVFVAVAEEQSVSVAAGRIGASASAVSQQITNLETALGASLLDRSSRPIDVTPAGALFLRRARAILNEAAEARAELAMADLSRLTRVNLGMIEDFDADVTPRLLADMAGDLRHTRFLLETGASHRLIGKLEDRALDMVVAADLDQARHAWMEVHPLLAEPFIAAVPKGTRDIEAAIHEMPFVHYTARHMMGRQIARHLTREGLTLDHRFELDSYHAIMAMVAEGAGWTILTPLGYLRAGRFRDAADVVPLPVAPLSRRIQLTARAGVFQDLPGQVAGRLRGLLAEMIVAPARDRMPWLSDELRVLD
ncbi:MAG: LysR family transcriptional regulator [Pseudomonadota bacterium]